MIRIGTRKMGAILAALAIAGVGGGALAHPKLLSATPPMGGLADAGTMQIRIVFNEAIFPDFSGVEVTDAAGRKVPVGQTANDPSDKKQIVIPLKAPLPPGDYTVSWHAVSTDTHRVKGVYTFKAG